MTEREPSQDQKQMSQRRVGDDRRSEVKPADNPVPSSPEPDADAVRAGEEKLDQVKPY